MINKTIKTIPKQTKTIVKDKLHTAINMKSNKNQCSNKKMTHFIKGNNKPIEIRVTNDQYDRAEKRAKALGVLRNSITHGKSNGWGMLGEEVVRDYLMCTDSDDMYNYDLLTPNGFKLEIKTKKTSMKNAPKGYFECSVCNHNAKQKCDMYVFVRVSTKTNKAWICGYKPKEDFMREARFFRKGDTDPSNGYKVHASCYNMNISELENINKIYKL